MIRINQSQNVRITIKGNNEKKNTTTNVRINSYQISTSYSGYSDNSVQNQGLRTQQAKPAQPKPYSKPEVNIYKPSDTVEIKMKKEQIVIPGITDVPKTDTIRKSTSIYGSCYGYYGIFVPNNQNNTQNNVSNEGADTAQKTTRHRKRNRKRKTYNVYTTANKPVVAATEEKKADVVKEAEKISSTISTEAKKSNNKYAIAFGICAAALGTYLGYKYFQVKKAKSRI